MLWGTALIQPRACLHLPPVKRAGQLHSAHQYSAAIRAFCRHDCKNFLGLAIAPDLNAAAMLCPLLRASSTRPACRELR
jgi:hypothetical protein